MSESKVYFGLNEDDEVMAVLRIPSKRFSYERWFRDGKWTARGSAGDVFRMNSISEEEAMRRTSGVRPDFSIWDNHK
ncbi:MAG: hypothetical protein RR956_07955 [Christensenella sp.]